MAREINRTRSAAALAVAVLMAVVMLACGEDEPLSPTSPTPIPESPANQPAGAGLPAPGTSTCLARGSMPVRSAARTAEAVAETVVAGTAEAVAETVVAVVAGTAEAVAVGMAVAVGTAVAVGAMAEPRWTCVI